MHQESERERVRLRVVVVSALPAVRAGLAAMLAEDPAFEVSAAGSLAWDGPPLAGPSVVVIDLEEGEGPAVMETLGMLPAVLLAHTPADFAALPPALAARAHLLDDTTAEELQAAVHAVAAGLVVFAPGALPRFEAAGHAPVPAPSPLTERELQVLRLMSDGLANKAIALRLGITEHTVKFHVAAILGKLNAGSRTEAVTTAVRAGILPL